MPNDTKPTLSPAAKAVREAIQPKWCKATAGAIVLETYTADPAEYDAEAKLARLLQVHEATLLEAASDPSQILIGDGPDCLLGWDTESYIDPDTGKKQIISNQLHLLAEGGELSDLYYSPNGDRISLIDRIIRMLIKAKEKGIILQWPRRIIVGAYFSRADFDSVTEFQEVKHHLDSAGGRICTIGKGITYSFLPHSVEQLLDQGAGTTDEEKSTGITPRRTSAVVSEDGRLRLLSIIFRDMAGFVAMGTSLDAVGDQIGIEKVKLEPEDDKSRMHMLLKRDKDLFERYALTDPKIVVKFMAETMILAQELTGSSELPPTASSLAQKFFLKTLDDAGLTREACFGVMKVKSAVWSERADRVRTVTDEVALPQREDHRAFITKCYHGGLNMVMYSGASEIDEWHDFDLNAAYPSAMTSIRLPDFEHPRVSINVDDYMGDVLGFAHVEFDYGDVPGQRGLPVDGGNRGILTPNRGQSYCTAAELAVAVRQGCRITTFYHGVIYPWKGEHENGVPTDIRVFKPFVRESRRRRALYPKGSAKEQLMKLISNALYGRTAMGLVPKRVFDTRTGASIQLPPSAITNEVVAAHVTGIVRATLAEILGNLPAGKRALSVTTDGFITNCSLDELPLNGVMAQRYMDWAELVTDSRQILEEKHRVKQVVVMKTRGQITAEYDDTVAAAKQTILAKVGVSPPPYVLKANHNEYMLDLYLNRRPGQKTTTRPFVSVRAQWSTDSGFTRLEREQTLNLEPDMKNQLINPRMVKVRGVEHIAFDTKPWPSADAGLHARAIFDGWIKKNCLKTMDDWLNWQDYYQLGIARRAKLSQGRPGVGIHMTDEGAIGLLRRMFLRAWTREALGLVKTISGPQLAKWLTDIGMATVPNDVKNAGRATHRLEEGIVPRSQEVLARIEQLKERFPEADLDRLLIPESLIAE
jgi:hypothetical protein